MSNFYFRQSEHDPNSYNVFVRGRLNSFGEPYCVLPMASYEEAHAYCYSKPNFSVGKIRLAFQHDVEAFCRATDIAAYLYENDLWHADQILYVEFAETVHNKIFSPKGVDDFELRQMLVQFAPDYSSRRAMYISPYAHDIRIHFAHQQLEEDIRISLMEIQTAPIHPNIPYYRAMSSI